MFRRGNYSSGDRVPARRSDSNAMEVQFTDVLLFLIPIGTFLALAYFLFRFLHQQGRRNHGD